MNIDELKAQIIDLLTEPLERERTEIADVALSHYKNNWTLRLFVYSEQGTTIDECARLSRIVGGIIDGTDYFESGYTLEVSSPGLDRPLTTATDFKFRRGETVRIEFIDRSRKKVTGKILNVSGDSVTFAADSEEFTVRLDEIQKAKIIF
jgi:ribosome maturation factor RimP